MKNVMPEHALGYDVDAAIAKVDSQERYRGGWWRSVVKPGLEALEADERAENAADVHTLVDTVGREELPGSGQKLNEHTDAPRRPTHLMSGRIGGGRMSTDVDADTEDSPRAYSVGGCRVPPETSLSQLQKHPTSPDIRGTDHFHSGKADVKTRWEQRTGNYARRSNDRVGRDALTHPDPGYRTLTYDHTTKRDAIG